MHREGDLVVMPVTFPDGTTAEVVYPPTLGLERYSVYPDTYAEGPSACGWAVHATRYDPEHGWVRGTEPLARFARTDGVTAELWDGGRSSEPHDYLVLRVDPWTVLVPCRWGGEKDREAVSIWAENLHGHVSPDGLLVLTGTRPLEVNPFDDRDGPAIRFSTEDVVVDLTLGPEACRWDGDRDAADGVVQWCIEPEGGIWLYATAFRPQAEDVLRALVGDLGVRNVRSPG